MFIGGLTLGSVISCGEQPLVLPAPFLPASTASNTPLPDAKWNSAPPLKDPPSSSFTGTIAELWALPRKTSGLSVTIPQAIVTANSGNGQTMYINDPELLDNSAIQVTRCDSADTGCKSNPPAHGAEVAVVGTLFANRDGGVTIGKATVVVDPDVALLPLQPRLTYVSSVEKGRITGNEAIRATYVALVDEAGNPARFVVADLAPADDQNGNFPPELDGPCAQDKAIATGVSCCPAGIGPKYFSFVIKEVASGRLVSVGTGNYRNIDFSSYACSNKDQAKLLKLGDEFTHFAGIFDISFGKASVSPARLSDYTLVKH